MIKHTLLSLVFLTLFMHQEVKSQTFCSDTSSSKNAKLYSSSMNFSNVKNSYNLRIYVHVVRTSGWTGGQSINDVTQALSFLDLDFNPHNIYFTWDKNIDYINSNIYYDSPSNDIFNINKHSDGIDIYLFDDSSPAGGLANGLGESSEFFISGSHSRPPYNSLIKSHVMSHEMGHVLFLHHTHYGINGNSTGEGCPENVDGSNSKTCGDYVEDTPADPNLIQDVDHYDCIWNGFATDGNGDDYTPDETLIMSYTHPDCMTHFSNGQGQRMRNAIATLPHLINSVIDDETNCVSDLTIIEDILFKNTVITEASNTITSHSKINSGANVTYSAGVKNILKSGFHAKSGSIFRAHIEGCNSSIIFAKSQQKKTAPQQQTENIMKLYPNPTTGLVNITSSQHITSWQLNNLLGRSYFDQKQSTNIKELTLDLSSYPSGIYILRTKFENGEIIIKKIIKD